MLNINENREQGERELEIWRKRRNWQLEKKYVKFVMWYRASDSQCQNSNSPWFKFQHPPTCGF